MTDELRTLYLNNKTIFNQKVEVYVGTAELDITDFEKVNTLYVDDITNNDVKYSIPLKSTQAFTQQKIFSKKTTTLFKGFGANDVLTEIEALSAEEFNLVEHDAEWEDSPNETVGYLTLRGQSDNGTSLTEVLKYWSKDSTKFYGDPNNGGIIQRKVFGTHIIRSSPAIDTRHSRPHPDSPNILILPSRIRSATGFGLRRYDRRKAMP